MAKKQLLSPGPDEMCLIAPVNLFRHIFPQEEEREEREEREEGHTRAGVSGG